MSTEANKVANDGISVEIDGNVLEAKKGEMIIHVADRAGIPIPRFCYHKKLSIAASCRMCMVDVEKAPKPLPACATPVGDGMKIYTQSRRALDAQRNVMEFLLINHPLDCPICDQGGECELQDVAMGYGRSLSRFSERKRIVADENIGPLVATDMTRCIHCTRCVRFMNEVANSDELGGIGRGEHLEIGTYIGKSIESELSGNIVDVCPVGALTNKPFRYQARAWELMARPGIATHDGLGSHLFSHIRRNEILRRVPKEMSEINQCWLADRDRYSQEGLRSKERLTKPLHKVDGKWQEATWPDAFAALAEVLDSAKRIHAQVHPSTSNEEGWLLKQLLDGLTADTSIDARGALGHDAPSLRAQPWQASLQEIAEAKSVVLIGCEPRDEAPMLALRLREMRQAGGKLTHIAGNPLANGLDADQYIAADPSQWTAQFASSVTAADVVIVGEQVLRRADAASVLTQIADHTQSINAKLNVMHSGANALGLSRLGLLDNHSHDADVAIWYGLEPEHDLNDPARTLAACQESEQVIAFASFVSPALQEFAHWMMPIAAAAETEGSYENLMGMRQTMAAQIKPSESVKAGWRVLRMLGGEMGVSGFDWTHFEDIDLPDDAVKAPAFDAALPTASSMPEQGLQRIGGTGIYRTDAMVRRATPLQQHPLNLHAHVRLNPADADARGINDGDTVKVKVLAGAATMTAVLDEGITQGCAWIQHGFEATSPLGYAPVHVEAVKDVIQETNNA